MGMKYCSAFLMAVLGGKENPSTSDIKTILEAVGAEFDESIAERLVSEMQGKTVHELIAAGKEKLVGFGGGGGGGSPSGNVGGLAASTSEAQKEVKKEAVVEEEEEDIDFDLFG